jgi:hypothetical protein
MRECTVMFVTRRRTDRVGSARPIGREYGSCVSDELPVRDSPRFTWLFLPLRLGPRHAEVRLTADALFVRMGWAFKATVPRGSIRWARRAPDDAWPVGVHSNFRGRWLVNGSSLGVVELGLDPPVRARTSVIPVTVSVLGLGLRDPEGLLKTLAVPEHD